MKKLIYVSVLLLSINFGYGQEKTEYPESFQELYSIIFNGDTIAILDLPDVSVVRYKFNDTREKFLYNKTRTRVEKVIPYYEIAINVLKELEEKEEDSSKKDFRRYKRRTKKELINKFEKELRDLTQSEGKILVKMINRNTGYSFNDLIKEYNSPIKVWGYNIVAKRFGYDLKEKYDPDHIDNKYIEMALKSMAF